MSQIYAKKVSLVTFYVNKMLKKLKNYASLPFASGEIGKINDLRLFVKIYFYLCGKIFIAK